ncbi:MAG TPA: class I SAM-dependent methyltransferase [Terriglobales bacterium]|jgi:ubiquinone/menaquinone biosynthesis C-methylase UbiE|nr:class I SAM-dependent methyltransferase [Terriglobales bacterium]
MSQLFWRVACSANLPPSKNVVADFWDADPCGTRYLGEKFGFEAHARARYQLEPHISNFAGLASAHGLRVLEIGVGMGADYEQWLKAGAFASGVDLSPVSLERTRRRCKLAGLAPDLHLADAENLPFAENSFDVVYSYGVMHHSPDTRKCLRESWRVLKPGGEARIMLYHHVSLTGIMLWLRFGLWHRQSIRQCVYEKLESPGTKTFTRSEVLELMRDFENVSIGQVFSPGDLLLHEPSPRFSGTTYQILWKLFPRALVRKMGKRWGLFLLIRAEKPR